MRTNYWFFWKVAAVYWLPIRIYRWMSLLSWLKRAYICIQLSALYRSLTIQFPDNSIQRVMLSISLWTIPHTHMNELCHGYYNSIYWTYKVKHLNIHFRLNTRKLCRLAVRCPYVQWNGVIRCACFELYRTRLCQSDAMFCWRMHMGSGRSGHSDLMASLYCINMQRMLW